MNKNNEKSKKIESQMVYYNKKFYLNWFSILLAKINDQSIVSFT